VVLAETADVASEIDLERGDRARREAEHVLRRRVRRAGRSASARAALAAPRRRSRQNHDAIRPNLQEAAEMANSCSCPPLFESQHSLSQQRDQRRVVRQDAELALTTGTITSSTSPSKARVPE